MKGSIGLKWVGVQWQAFYEMRNDLLQRVKAWRVDECIGALVVGRSVGLLVAGCFTGLLVCLLVAYLVIYSGR